MNKTIALLVIVFAGWWWPELAQAAIYEVSDVAGGVPVNFSVSTPDPIRLKACFSTFARDDSDPSATNLECSGLTYNGTTWLGQSDSWSEFPLVTPQVNQIKSVLAVQSQDLILKPYLYIIYLADGKSSVSRQKAPLHFDVRAKPTNRRVEVGAYSETSPYRDGWVVSQTNGGVEWWPLIAGTASLRLNDSDSSLHYVAPDLVTKKPQTYYRFPVPGSYSVMLNQPAVTPVLPQIEPTQVSQGQTVTLYCTTQFPYKGRFEWWVDGTLQLNEELSTLVLDAPAGTHSVDVRLLDTNERAQSTLTVTPYTQIRFTHGVPAPVGETEVVGLENYGQQPIGLDGWKIESRVSKRALTLSDELASKAVREININSFFRNSGGIYELVSPTGLVVDRLAYPAVESGDRVVRPSHSIVWQVESAALGEEVDIHGTVVRRVGKSIDIASLGHGQIHAVVEKDIGSVKKGQTITLKGVHRITRGDQVEWRIVASTQVVLGSLPIKRPAVGNNQVLGNTIEPLASGQELGRAQFRDRPPPISPARFTSLLPVVLAFYMALGVGFITSRRVAVY